jgi:hypothetical protein
MSGWTPDAWSLRDGPWLAQVVLEDDGRFTWTLHNTGVLMGAGECSELDEAKSEAERWLETSKARHQEIRKRERAARKKR